MLGRWLPIFAGGAALGLSFPPFGLPALACVALVPLLHAWAHAPSWRAALTAAYACFLATFAVAFSWPLNHALPHVALASLTGVLLLPLWMALPFAAAWPVRQRLGAGIGFAALCAFFLLMEAALSLGPLALPWPLLGHTQAEALAVNQFADLTGVPGLTLWILLLDGALYHAVSADRHRLLFAGTAAALLALPLAYSAWRLAEPAPPAPTLRIGLVQPGLDAERWAGQSDTARVRLLLALSDALVRTEPRTDLVVWPETALPLAGSPAQAAALRHRLQRWAGRTGVALLSGAVTAAKDPLGRPAYRNSALLITPSAPPVQYDKRRLVPFVEQAPLATLLPILNRLTLPSGGVPGYLPGASDVPLPFGDHRLGVLICLETVFSGLARRYAADGAGLLVAVTQDGWWGPTPGQRQHLAFARLRAIESRRALAHVSVSGETALVLPDGSVPARSTWMQRTTRLVEAPLGTGKTFFTTHGPWLNLLALAVALSSATVALVRPPRRTARRLTFT